jgi:hypothetical protein
VPVRAARRADPPGASGHAVTHSHGHTPTAGVTPSHRPRLT